jgi:hypothetical protein
MDLKRFSFSLTIAAALLVGRAAGAQPAPAPPTPEPPPIQTAPSPTTEAPAAPAPPTPTVVTAPPQVTIVAPANATVVATPPPAEVQPMQLTVPWNGPTGRGVGIGFEEGAWAGVWGNGLRVFVPFYEAIGGRYAGSIGMNLRGLVFFGSGEACGTVNVVAPISCSSVTNDHYGGRFELIGRSPVFLNLVRLYGGGGVELFSVFGSDVSDHAVKVGGGGQFGFEFFLGRRFSFYLEVGGHSGAGNYVQGGETVIAGMNVYPFFR